MVKSCRWPHQIIHFVFSIAGHNLPSIERVQSTGYMASKHAVTVLTDGLRKELVSLKSKIRVTVNIIFIYR